jgi:hypothetical protein
MIRLTDCTAITAPADRVWDWFATLDASYREWHPEHIRWQTLKGKPLDRGTTEFVDEWIGRSRLAGQFRITEVVPGRYLGWAMLFPHSLVNVGGSFALEPTDAGCNLVAEVHMGWSLPVLGPLLDKVISTFVPISELRRHMVEEGRNLARLLSDRNDVVTTTRDKSSTPLPDTGAAH